MGNYLDRPLIEYLPGAITKIREYQALMHGEQPEVFGLFAEIENVLNNQFIESSTEYGVNRWEKMLEITPPASLTLSERKFNIVARLTEKLPFTHKMLEQMLTELCGKGNFTIDLNFNTYTLKIKLEVFSSKNAESVSSLLKRVCPANLICVITNDIIQSANLHYIGAMFQSFTHILSATVDLTQVVDLTQTGFVNTSMNNMITEKITQKIQISI